MTDQTDTNDDGEEQSENTDRGERILNAILGGFEGSGEEPYPDMISGDGDVVIDTSDSVSSDFLAKQRKIERFRERLEERGDLTDEQIRRRIKLRTGALRPPNRDGKDESESESDNAP